MPTLELSKINMLSLIHKAYGRPRAKMNKMNKIKFAEQMSYVNNRLQNDSYRISNIIS
ncbi:hypothetical protein CLV42_118131 [Chitinophaga ginsengisoli]|uniref:Uncharacterized protein n=1 Tax=Chitinophaga ginsengisoli TaxID=363837 RepID=A0A2P8FNW9_9BACT|nr:hypothetical protein CLV42_118131 [Chitinophaga ginsengisoli]